LADGASRRGAEDDDAPLVFLHVPKNGGTSITFTGWLHGLRLGVCAFNEITRSGGAAQVAQAERS
jgi:hypothetical protein